MIKRMEEWVKNELNECEEARTQVTNSEETQASAKALERITMQIITYEKVMDRINEIK